MLQESSTFLSKPKCRQVEIPFEGGKVVFGDKKVVVIAGPCSIESRQQFQDAAQAVRSNGASVLRGGIFKMRTDPKSFQGLGEAAFVFIREIKRSTRMPLVSEITDPRQIEFMDDLVDMFQVGSRNMYNYELLKEIGRQKKPVMLKRSFAATIDEWIKAAHYIESSGNTSIVLCERGIRTFETKTRNTLDLNAIAYIKEHTDYPVIVDPSHGTGRPELISRMAAASIAAGADGIMVEVHPNPAQALSDGFQAFRFEQFTQMMTLLDRVALSVARHVL